MNEKIDDLKFILEVMQELSVNPEDYDFGPAYEMTKDRKKLAMTKLRRLIKQEKLNEL